VSIYSSAECSLKCTTSKQIRFMVVFQTKLQYLCQVDLYNQTPTSSAGFCFKKKNAQRTCCRYISPVWHLVMMQLKRYATILGALKSAPQNKVETILCCSLGNLPFMIDNYFYHKMNYNYCMFCYWDIGWFDVASCFIMANCFLASKLIFMSVDIFFCIVCIRVIVLY